MSLAELSRPVAAWRLRPVPAHWVFACLTVTCAALLILSFAMGVADWSVAAVLAVGLAGLTALWIAGGAATAMMGLFATRAGRLPIPDDWEPTTKTAILVTLCGEPAAPLARHIGALLPQLARASLEDATTVFVLSDTSGAERIAAEEAALAPLVAAGSVNYRRRHTNTSRKPGNIADWLATHGDTFDHMLILDADSRMSADRIRAMIWRMEARPRLGLLQSGIAIVPGATRFGRHQRVASRLMSANFGRGLASWTGSTGNYWGHNAIIRVAAFRHAAALPHLSGPAPFGGDLLSHDFIEAAWIRRAGWGVELDPETCGSAESAPETLSEFHRRDRRWCQGNLQHLRLLGTPGLAAISRFHLAAGILSYLVAPAWLVILVLIASGAVTVTGALPLIVVASVLAVPKFCALIDWLGRTRTPWRRRVVVRAWLGEAVVSSLVAPLVMVRQVGAVLSVCSGRDCGWKSGRAPLFTLPRGTAEAVAGAGLVALPWAMGGPVTLWLLPVVLPLCAAPVIIRLLDTPAT